MKWNIVILNLCAINVLNSDEEKKRTMKIFLTCPNYFPFMFLVKITEIVPDDDVSFQDGSPESGMYIDASSFQCIRFQTFQQTQWHTLCDHNLKEL